MVFKDMSKTKIRNLQMEVERAIDEMVESGAERGLQVAVYQSGKQIVDAVAGVADPASGRPFTSETPVYCYSVCKAAASTLVHMLAERRAFGYDTRVAELWPEFGAHGKQGVTIRHVLNHTAGVPGIPLTTTIEDLCDWDKMCTAIADSEPWWEPGTKIGYHAYTFGYIVGEIIRRVTGKPISQVLREELSVPLGVREGAVLRHAALRTPQAGGARGHADAARFPDARDAARPSHVQGGPHVADAERGVRQPRGHPGRGHSGRGQDVCPRHRANVCRLARRSRRRAASLAGALARGDERAGERSR